MPPIKKFNIFFCSLAAAGSVLGCAAGRPVPASLLEAKAVTPAALGSRPFPEQERLVYRVSWMGIAAGELVAEIKGRVNWKGRSCHLIEVSGRTTGFVAAFYKVDDHYRSYLDVERLHTLRFEEHRHEGGYHKDAVTDFDHEAGKAYFSNAADGSQKVFDIPSGVQDSLTGAYVARFLPLAPGAVFTYKICNSEKVYDLYLSIPARSVYNGKPVLRLVPMARINGTEFREGRASGYVTDDARKVPVAVVIKAPVFTSVTALLVEPKK